MKKTYFIHRTSIIEKSVSIGKGTEIWLFSHIMPGAKIGKNCIIGQNVYIGQGVTIGNNVKIENNVSVYERVILEDFVFCGPSCVFTNVLTPRSKYPKKPEEFLTTLVKKGATIGANATILCGHIIGKNALIGAGAVVTKDVSDYAIVVGSPAKLVGWACECGQRLIFKRNRAVCNKCKRKYKKEENKIFLL